ncbi:MAG: hydroxylamine oxidase [candidate division Zixibacteria bacterium]|nr:hydroxylamine oxidase [candidate division Zixibacteria bacterium]
MSGNRSKLVRRRTSSDKACRAFKVIGPDLLAILVLAFPLNLLHAQEARVSEATESCLPCHASVTPGIVADWEKSLHSEMTPADAVVKEKLGRRVSADSIPDDLKTTTVGCAECHNMNPEKHRDSFEHGGYQVHTVVTPEDCAACHPTERSQYEKNIMSYAHINLTNNPVYHSLITSINGIQDFDGSSTTLTDPDEETDFESCLYCHGTEVMVQGTTSRETVLGEMEFPLLSGWPNQGVGRINPDGSMGSCAACHTRHQFSIQMARKPYTCSECHKGPDVPAYKVYQVSKHGNIFSSLGKEWDFDAVPWVVGRSFTAPTCAACHVSLLTNSSDEVVAQRSHQMNDRLWWRIFGVIYAHPHPVSPNTATILNQAGLPLPTELSGEPAADYLIDEDEMNTRRQTMQTVCVSCHSSQWVENQFARFENTIRTTNEMTLTATKILSTAWEKGVAVGLPQRANIFDEAIEKKWVEQWLFFANSTRFASAMSGADYGVFANGRWYMSKNIQEMHDWLRFKLQGGTEKK